MRLLSSMSPHVDHQHVLRFERFLVSGTSNPAANEGLLASVDMVRIYVLHQVILSWELEFAIHLNDEIYV